jgi:hypothetical protein
VCNEGWEILLRVMSQPRPRVAFVSLATSRIKVQLARGDVAGAEQTLDQVATWGSEHDHLAGAAAHPNFTFLRG